MCSSTLTGKQLCLILNVYFALRFSKNPLSPPAGFSSTATVGQIQPARQTTAMAETLSPVHPYSPASAPLPHYAANELPLAAVVGSLAAMLGAAALGSAGLAARVNPRLGGAERCIVGWFSICRARCRVLLGFSWVVVDSDDLGRRVSPLLL